MNGKVIKRNVAHVKKLPQTTSPPETMPTTSTPDPVSATSASDASPNLPEDNDYQNSVEEPKISAASPPQLPPLKLVKEGGMWRPANAPTM